MIQSRCLIAGKLRLVYKGAVHHIRTKDIDIDRPFIFGRAIMGSFSSATSQPDNRYLMLLIRQLKGSVLMCCTPNLARITYTTQGIEKKLTFVYSGLVCLFGRLDLISDLAD